MFRCVDCGCEYEVKPDFCDCGNDVFEEIVVEQFDFEDNYDTELTPKVKHKKTFEEQYPGLSSFMETLDPISVIIFILCIILSVCSFIFIKPKEKPVEQNPKPEEKIERKVADINTFWNDTPPKPEPKKEEEEPNQSQDIVNQIINIIPKTEPKNDTGNNNSQNNTQKPAQIQNPQPKTQIKPAQQPQIKPAQQPQQQKPKQQTQVTKPKQTQQVQQQKPKQTQTTQQQKPKQQTQVTKPKQTQPAQQPQQQKPSAPQNNQNTQPKVQQPPVQQIQQPVRPINVTNNAQAAQELKDFKLGLQSAFASKIKNNLLQVYGDGSCVVDFKVDSTGKLINRSFSTQSSNDTLNDVVYNAVMSTPKYNPPPSSYSGQTLHLSVKFNNGMVKISVY